MRTAGDAKNFLGGTGAYRDNPFNVKKRLRVVSVTLLLAGLGLAVWFTSRSREPVYQGRELSSWLRDCVPGGGMGETEEEKMAIKALQHAGSNAIPVLFKYLRAKDSAWQKKLQDYAHDKLDMDFGVLPADKLRYLGAFGFSALGTNAEPAIPQLAAWAKGSDAQLSYGAVIALGGIEHEKTTAPLLAALQSPYYDTRLQAAYGISFHPYRARTTASNLVALFPQTDGTVRRVLAGALRSCWDQPILVVPALITLLNDPDPKVQGAAARSLGKFGTDAKSALPDLTRILPPVDATNSSLRQLRSGARRALVRVQCQMYEGAITRGPTEAKRVALVFTAHEFAEGGDTILNELARHQAKASFFVTGVFMDNSQFSPIISRIAAEGHYLGPHSDKHLLYCPWEDRKKTLVSREEFQADLRDNSRKIERFNDAWRTNSFFLPPFEYYNRDITDWTTGMGTTLINFTPGTRSNADYTGEADKNFVSSPIIFDSIVKKEREDPHGLNGFMLLLHLGVGPGRQDKFHQRFGELLDYLSGKGYQFVRVDELLEAKETNATNSTNP